LRLLFARQAKGKRKLVLWGWPQGSGASGFKPFWLLDPILVSR